MTAEDQKSILTIALYAAFADGDKHDRERQEIRRIADSLATQAHAPELGGLYQDVLLQRVKLDTAATALSNTGLRQLAYEMAVCVCDADGRQSEPERLFLQDLKGLLKLNAASTEVFEREADTVLTLSDTPVSPVPVAPASVPLQATASESELDKSILNYALLNGALELLPQSWASMAIIPLQIKMVYGLGKAHGVELDQGHIKEFIAAAGVGLTSQYLEQFGRKLLGGLLGKMAGRTIGKVGGAATGMAMSFATTYALGQLAKGYYRGGRVMNTALLRQTYQDLLGPAQQMQTRYLPQIQQKAATLDMGQVMAMARGG
ncbi:DUF533 domain-containing protein [Rhodoferax sp.]|uniref:YcjF family protein n=1 Tax=Rhodoferax sp. TaxID=50421 RepID=UPI0025EE83FF|nr:DUF533 domain-containing protein [Rhodoferax sp.]